MKPIFILLASMFAAHAHEPSDPGFALHHQQGGVLLAQATANTPDWMKAPAGGNKATPPPQAAAFTKFAPAVKARWDERYLYIEGNGLPAHNMMVGITAWQQQVPLPQAYTGANAWRLPLIPVPSKTPASIRDRFLRGAIAIAANGIPIFNPQNNRGEISAEIGELDEWGGHCGRADDYHYHAAPLHLAATLGPKLPIAYALDGYPIYGLTEPDGTAPAGLDAFNGHSTQALGYHYHASKVYPYVNGGFHGEVVEAENQVDPQPRANPVRPALPQMRGAKITGFSTTPDGKTRKLVYQVGSQTGGVNFTDAGSGSWKFEFVSTDGTKREESYQAREGGGPRGGQEGRGPRGGGGRGDGERAGGGERPPRQDGERAPGAGGERPPGGEGGRPPGGEGERPRREQGERPPRDGGRPGEQGRPRGEQGATTNAEMDALKKPDANFVLSSAAIPDPKSLPVEFTGDGAGISPPLEWKGAPAATKSFAIVMDHLAPGNDIKSYWVMWDIPAGTSSLPKDARSIGKLGTGFRRNPGYEPPHSKGPGAKTYIITLYALSAPAEISQPAADVKRETLLAAIKGKVLASASLPVTYTRTGDAGEAQGQRPPQGGRDERRGPGSDSREEQNGGGTPPPPPPPRADEPPAPRGEGQRQAPGGPGAPGEGRRPGGGAGAGLVKATMADTVKGSVYADNWFALYINGRLTVVDPIAFLPHNVVNVDILPEYPMTIAVIAHDNADLKTGLEYGNHIGDAGFILKFADGTVTDGSWKALAIERGPIGGDIANPRVENDPRPQGWTLPDFDDSKWENAHVFTEQEVNPKQPYFEADFKGAQFIWSKDLGLDNTVLFRKRVEKPGWKPRWTAQPAGPLPQL